MDETKNKDSFPNPEQDLGEKILSQISELKSVLEEISPLHRDEHPDCVSLLSRNDAADRLSISTRKLDELADRGEIQPTRIDGRVLYRPETLEAYVDRVEET